MSQSAPDPAGPDRIAFRLDGREVSVKAEGTLLDALRGELRARGVKDGCSPQGQCGCCTVLVDGQPRVSCVTPVRRIAGRSVVTVDGLDPAVSRGWSAAFCAAGGSQCGFCTPGIICRLEGTLRRGALDDRATVDRALSAHLCRCTGWQTIREAAGLVAQAGGAEAIDPGDLLRGRDLEAASRRATIEGRTGQCVAPDVALGHGGFADDCAPEGALVAIPDGAGGWAVGESLAEARAAAGKVQGRRSTIELRHPIALPPGEWHATLQTTWVEPAYLETDASWCLPGGEPASALGNGGAFGGKVRARVESAARELADRHGRPVRVLWTREEVVRCGPKRPPIAAGVRRDGTGVVRVARTPGIVDAITSFAPELEVETVDVKGPPTSAALRAAGWAEAHALRVAVAGSPLPVRSPEGAVAEAELDERGVRVKVRCGRPLDEVVLRSYCIGAAHMALGWVRREALRVDEDGAVHDLTIRSFGVLRSSDTPPISVDVEPAGGEPVNGSDAVFAAVAAAAWLEQGLVPTWPTEAGAKR